MLSKLAKLRTCASLVMRSAARLSAASALPSRAMSSNGFSYPAPRTLEALVNLDKFSSEPAETIEQIWVEHHAAMPTAMASAVPAADYARIAQRAASTPFFTLPVQRDSGHFMLLAQFQDRSWLLTYLEDYRRDPASALPYLTVTAYPELALTKGLVLLRSDICAPATITKADAARALRQLTTLYGDDLLYKHVFDFNENAGKFDLDAAMKAVNEI